MANKASINQTPYVQAKLNTGGSLPFRQVTAQKTGKPYFCILKPYENERGMGYDPRTLGILVDQEVITGKPNVKNAPLPTSVQVGDSTLTAVEDESGKGEPKSLFVGPVKVGDCTHILSLHVTKLDSGDFRVSGSMTGGKVKGERTERKSASSGPLKSL